MSTNNQALREAAEKANPEQYGYYLVDAFTDLATPATVLALLDELEAAQNSSVELPSFDGYVPHITKELQAAFKIACAAAGITVKGE